MNASQNVKSSDVLVYTNDVLHMFHCLYDQHMMWRKILAIPIFGIIDPMRAVSADHSQGNKALFGEHAGKQCIVMSLLL